eukprot:gene18758-13517_t
MATFATAPAVEEIVTASASPETSRKEDFLRACAQEDVETLRIILADAGSSRDELLQAKTADGRTALHVAVAVNRLDIVNVLLDQGANVNIADDTIRRFGRPALHDAISEHRAEIISALLAKEASVVQTDKFGKTALHVAMEAEAVEPEILGPLMAHPQANISLQDEAGRTVLHTAIASLDENEQYESVLAQLLKRKEFNPSLADRAGNTVLHLAAQQGLENILSICLHRSVPINAVNKLGQTALHVLVKAGYGIDEAKVLLDWPTCDLSLKDKKGLTVRDYAERYGDADLVEYFNDLANGAKATETASDAVTPSATATTTKSAKR